MDAALDAMRKAGATIVDVRYPKWLLDSKQEFYNAIRRPEFHAQIAEYLKTTGPGYPKTLPEMIELFSSDGLLRKAAIFDMKKLEWMNGQHLSLMPLEQLVPIVRPLIVQAGLATAAELEARRDWWFRLLELLRVRARTTHGQFCWISQPLGCLHLLDRFE